MRTFELRNLTKVVGALCGLVGGVAIGSTAGPVGVVLGVLGGGFVGAIAGRIIEKEEGVRETRTRELDAIIGVTQGSLGLGDAPRAAEDAEAKERESWLAEWLTPPPPNVTGTG